MTAFDSTSRSISTAVYPVNAKDPGTWGRLEPLISPEILRADHLFGIPLVSALPDPVTKMLVRYTDDLLKRKIVTAVSKVEEAFKITVFETEIEERQPFIYADFMSYGYFKIRQAPIQSIEGLSIQSSDGTRFFTVPAAWLEMGFAYRGQINILPLSPVSGAADLTGASLIMGGPAASIFMTFLARSGTIPAYWTVNYRCGFKDGKIPRLINEAIAVQAAMDILSSLAPTYQRASASIGIDGMSQSISTPGPELFKTRLADLQLQFDTIRKQMKSVLGRSFLMGAL